MALIVPGLGQTVTTVETDVTPKPDPTRVSGGQTGDDVTFGVFKFRGATKQKYFDYCFSKNLDINEIINQTNFLFKQLKEDDSLRGNELKEAETVEQAAQIIHEYILKDNTGLQNTIDTAYDLLDRNSV